MSLSPAFCAKRERTQFRAPPETDASSALPVVSRQAVRRLARNAKLTPMLLSAPLHASSAQRTNLTTMLTPQHRAVHVGLCQLLRTTLGLDRWTRRTAAAEKWTRRRLQCSWMSGARASTISPLGFGRPRTWKSTSGQSFQHLHGLAAFWMMATDSPVTEWVGRITDGTAMVTQMVLTSQQADGVPLPMTGWG